MRLPDCNKVARMVAAGEVEQLRAREKELGIEPDWEIDAFMKAAALEGKEHNILTDYIMRILGLEVLTITLLTPTSAAAVRSS